MSTDYRALCAELADALENAWDSLVPGVHPLVARARAALAQQHVSQPYKLPEPVAPTDEARQEFIEQVQRAQHVAIREGECPRFDLVECALAFCRETIPPAPEPVAPTDEEIIAFWSEHCAGDGDAGILRLARYGTPAIAAGLEAQ
jgi:hypothetical protein